jgi:hypothetical protein
LLQVGSRTSKSSLRTTMITGSNAICEAIPPHFQFQTSAKLEDTQQIQMEMGIYFEPI